MTSSKKPNLILPILLCLGLSSAFGKPNILFLNVDDLGWADLGVQGSEFYQTPNIDRLAAEGLRFTNGYAPASNCAPSRACVITGQYTPRHGVYTVWNSDRGKPSTRKLIPEPNTEHITPENITIAEVLKDGGYRTITLGKWHLSEDPTQHGFDINIGGDTRGLPYPDGYHSPYEFPNLTQPEPGEYLTDRLTSEAIAFLREPRDQPWFMYLPFYAVHTPIQGKEELTEKYEQCEATAAHNDPAYAAMIETVDTNIGRILHTLDELDIADNTLVIFTSDNGGLYQISKQWPLRAGKGAYYEGGIRVPLIVRWPGKVEPGEVSDVPVCGIDFFPTFLEAAEIQKPEDKILDGVSLVPLLTRQGSLRERPLFWHFPIYLQRGNEETQDPTFRTRPGSAMRLGDWKLIEYFESGDLELYNLAIDPSEKINLAEAEPEKARELQAVLEDWRKDLNAPVPVDPNPEYQPDTE